MSLRPLVDSDCGGINPLMQLQQQFTNDTALKDEGLSRLHFERHARPDDELANEFLGQITVPPQSFEMGQLLQEMHAIERMPLAPMIRDSGSSRLANQWNREYSEIPVTRNVVYMQPQQQQIAHVHEFFDGAQSLPSYNMQMHVPPVRLPIMQPYHVQPHVQQIAGTKEFFEEAEASKATLMQEDWVQDFQDNKESSEKTTSEYNEKFWTRLQNEWQKLSEESDHPWLSEFNENYDPYKEYDFIEQNPMADLDNAFEKGKEYLANGDIPSAVLCFEAAVTKERQNAEAWELLGLSQAKNEMDPQSIAAFKQALDLQPDNMRVLMALAIGYTNESLQSKALKMLTRWIQANSKYAHLLKEYPELMDENNTMASSLIRDNRLQMVQSLFLDAVRQNPQEIDVDVQEALGVLYNLSSEYDKAVDCFRAALQMTPENAKLWNRLGASLANGSRSVEAVEAYQHALQLEPGFIRVRYNVGVCCMNLKAYKQAAEHFLMALNMQAQAAAHRDIPATVTTATTSGQQQMSDAIWSTLKMVLSLMGRGELHTYIHDRNLTALNETFKE